MIEDVGTNRGSQASESALEQEVASLQAKFAMLRQMQHTSRVQLIGMSVVMIVVIAVFMGSMYSKMSSNFSQANVQNTLSARATHIVPLATEHLRGAAMSAAPVYAKLAKDRFEVVGPQVASRFIDRVNKLPVEQKDALLKRLQAALDRVNTRFENDLAQAFPTMSEQKRREMMADFRHDLVDNLTNTFTTMTNNDSTRLQEILAKFDIPVEGAEVDVAATEQQLVHTMLMLADHEVMSAGTDDDMFAAWEKIRQQAAQPVRTAPVATVKEGNN